MPGVQRRARQHGLTLTELLIGLGIISILAATAIEHLPGIIQSARMAGDVNRFVTALHLARSEAVKRGTRGVICASADGMTCSEPGNDDWSTGWIVFSDYDQDGSLTWDAAVNDCVNDDCIIRTRGPLNKTTLDGAGKSSIGFLPNGLVYSVAPYTLTLTADNCEETQSRTITVTRRGHTNVRKQGCPSP